MTAGGGLSVSVTSVFGDALAGHFGGSAVVQPRLAVWAIDVPDSTHPLLQSKLSTFEKPYNHHQS